MKLFSLQDFPCREDNEETIGQCGVSGDEDKQEKQIFHYQHSARFLILIVVQPTKHRGNFKLCRCSSEGRQSILRYVDTVHHVNVIRNISRIVTVYVYVAFLSFPSNIFRILKSMGI